MEHVQNVDTYAEPDLHIAEMDVRMRNVHVCVFVNEVACQILFENLLILYGFVSVNGQVQYLLNSRSGGTGDQNLYNRK